MDAFRSIAGSDAAALYWIRRLAEEPVDEVLVVDKESDPDEPLTGDT